MKIEIAWNLSIVAVVAAAVFAIGGCKKIKPGCVLAEKGAPPIADFISKKAACKKPEVMRAAVLDFCNNDLGLCKDDVLTTGPIAEIICPILAAYGKDALAKKLGEKEIMKRAECDANVGAASIVDPLLVACRLFPF